VQIKTLFWRIKAKYRHRIALLMQKPRRHQGGDPATVSPAAHRKNRHATRLEAIDLVQIADSGRIIIDFEIISFVGPPRRGC